MLPIGIEDDWSFNLSPEELLQKANDLITQCRKLYDSVGNVPETEVSYETVLKVLKEAECKMATSYFQFPQYVSQNEALRNASVKADRMIKEFGLEVRMRNDLFKRLLILHQKQEPLKYEDQRYLNRLVRLGKRNGLDLDEITQSRIRELTSKINNLCIDFTKNLNDVTTSLEFSDQDLDGVPDDILKSLERNPDSGKAVLTLKYPHYFAVMKKCRVPETRKKFQFAYDSQCIVQNSCILTELRKLRHECAALLGYTSHASYITEILMTKCTETVHKFLTELTENLKPLYLEEKKYLLELKEKECIERGISFDGKLNIWDMTYYNTMAREINYSLDENKLKEYFPFLVVKKGLLDIYQVLDLKFVQVKGDVWHEDVEMFSVQDASSGTLLGYFFLDLFPRPHKYSHAALFPLKNSYIRPDGTREISVGAIVANFTKPTSEKPALLSFDEVVTFFHEFGHVMHQVCIEEKYPLHSFLTKNLETDFIETPSQMLENWCWEKKSLKKMSAHYLDNSVLPDDMLDNLIKSRLANVGYNNLRQVVLALLDQRIYTNSEGDTKDIYNELLKQILDVESQDGTNFACHFGHLANGYDAQYYSYLWSEVYSADIYQTRFGEENVLNPEVGKDYRDKILKPGSSKDAIDLIISFLGREPTQDAFLQSKGLKL